MAINDTDFELLLPNHVEDESSNFNFTSRQSQQAKGRTRWAVVGRIIGTLTVLSSLIFVTLSVDSNTTLLPLPLDSPIRHPFNNPEQDPVKMALDGTWKEGFSPKTFNEFFENRMATCRSGKTRCRKNWDKL
ncbi:hypothetical protein FRC01_008148, partial [Tulasnella sp. 417]